MTVTPAALSHAGLADAFRAQARGCALTGSPIYSELLDRAADDVARGGIFADLVSTYRGVPMLDALPLRVLGAVHALVLGGRAPGLAAFYPSTGGHFEAEGAFRALCEVCDAHRDELRDEAGKPTGPPTHRRPARRSNRGSRTTPAQGKARRRSRPRARS